MPLEIRSGTDQILLRTNRAVFKAGDRIELKVLSTRSRGAAYVDVVKNGQTILTRDVDLENGQAESDAGRNAGDGGNARHGCVSDSAAMRSRWPIIAWSLCSRRRN